MTKVHKKYDRAVELIKHRKKLSELGREPGISAAQLYKWRIKS